jgi:hypothetical protein
LNSGVSVMGCGRCGNIVQLSVAAMGSFSSSFSLRSFHRQQGSLFLFRRRLSWI